MVAVCRETWNNVDLGFPQGITDITFEKGMEDKSMVAVVMSNTFDTKSKEIISENPQYITALNADIESGLYKNVMEMVQYQRDVKAIPDNVSDIEAYIGTVQQMARQEQSGAQSQQQAQNKQQSTANPNSGTSRKRRVGMSGNRATSKKKEQKYDPMQIMEMSDDDFDKKFGGKLL